MADLLAKISVFLFAAIVAVPIANFLRLGSVLGYLLAGIIIGPSILGFMGTEAQSALHHISEFGVVMMLFLIGLELKLSILWRLKVPILGLGGMQMLLCSLALAGMAYLFNQEWRKSIAIGLILALSSTAIVVQTLSEKKLLATKGGRASFSVLLFQDISVIPILAILPLLVGFSVKNSAEHANSISRWLFTQPEYIRFLAIFLSLALIVLIGKFLSVHIFRFVISRGGSELFTATALLTVVGVAFLMESLGLSAALGTFVAGVMLSESAYRHEIELAIEPFKGLLLGLFFMTVGAGIDFQLFASKPDLIIRWVILLICIKMLVIFIIGKIFRYKSLQSLLMACALAQGGEFAYVLFAFCKSNFIFNSDEVQFFNLVVTLSMLTTPFLMIAYDAVYKHHTRRSQKEINIKQEWDEQTEVIIAGYGSFNETVARLLIANARKCTIIDNNPELIATLKKFNHTLYYGDATNPKLLKLAGADQAKVLVIGFSDTEQVKKVVKIAHEHFPNLSIIARAADRIGVYHLMEQKVDAFQRDDFLSAIDVGKKVLIELGIHPYTAHRQARLFCEYDDEMLLELYQEWKDDKLLRDSGKASNKYISRIRELSNSLETLLRADKRKNEMDDHAWEPPPTETELIEKAIRQEMINSRAKEQAEKAVAAVLATEAIKKKPAE